VRPGSLPTTPTVLDTVVVGAGQAGLSTSRHLVRLGARHVVLDANELPGGAWQHRWDSLSMADVHGVADLPDAPAPGTSAARANLVVPEWFGDYEERFALPVLHGVRVDRVTSEGDLLVVHAGTQRWTARTLVNATGTWTRPFVPHYRGTETFAGEQLHTADYPGREHFVGRRVVLGREHILRHRESLRRRRNAPCAQQVGNVVLAHVGLELV